MIIAEETGNKLVIKKVPSYRGLIVIALGFVLAIFALALAGSAPAEPQGKSRTPVGAAVFVFPIGGLIMFLFEWRQNRKSLTLDSNERTATVVGPNPATFPFDEIEGFLLGRAVMTTDSAIDISLKNGQRVRTGIDSRRGNADDVEKIMKKLGERLKSGLQV